VNEKFAIRRVGLTVHESVVFDLLWWRWVTVLNTTPIVAAETTGDTSVFFFVVAS